MSAQAGYMRSEAAATYLGIKKSLLLEWTRKGILPAYPINRKVLLYSQAALDRALELLKTPSVFEQMAAKRRRSAA